MSDDHRVAVKRDGPRGWHWIAKASFDPAVHEMHVEGAKPAAAEPLVPDPAPPAAARPRGRRPALPKP